MESIRFNLLDFGDCTRIGEGRFWKLYEGKIPHANNVCTSVIAKWWDREAPRIQFLTELHILSQYKHENIITLVRYYTDHMDVNIIFYEHASNGRLSKHLGDPRLTWMKRLKICVGIANGLKFLHKGGVEHEDSIKHRDIKSGSILLDGDCVRF